MVEFYYFIMLIFVFIVFFRRVWAYILFSGLLMQWNPWLYVIEGKERLWAQPKFFKTYKRIKTTPTGNFMSAGTRVMQIR